ncbi:hypothetical protein C0995_008352 [Termitomyces sp. Mi166|nr:hypothetical protein C0995_008352 [Termitomyces sp. Mi166\
MQIKFLLATLASSSLSIVNGAVDARAASDIFSPPIISPNASTIWIVGNVEIVTWNTSSAPVNISNRASVVLRPAGQLTPDFVLATDFNLRSGSVNVTVPDTVAPGDYDITLFGDSGNVSPTFEIVAAN